MRLRGLRWRGELPLCLLLDTGLYQAGRRRGEQASLDHGDSRGVSTPTRSAPGRWLWGSGPRRAG